MFKNPRRGRQARNFTTNVPRKILDVKSSYEQIFSKNLIAKQLSFLEFIVIVIGHSDGQTVAFEN